MTPIKAIAMLTLAAGVIFVLVTVALSNRACRLAREQVIALEACLLCTDEELFNAHRHQSKVCFYKDELE